MDKRHRSADWKVWEIVVMGTITGLVTAIIIIISVVFG